jgi:acyl-CoA synthetase (NDP forming)
MKPLTPDSALAAGHSVLDEIDAKAWLRAAGVPVPQGARVTNEAQARDALAQMTPPFVVKVISPEVLHKSDAGGVHLNLADAKEVCSAMVATADLPGRTGWLVEEMAQSGHELMVGAVRHPRFGPMVMVGLGGVWVEYLNDVALRICPIDRNDALDMLASLRTAPILDGARGKSALDKDAIVDTLIAVGGSDGLLLRHADAIAELDINPLIVSENGLVAVDARVLLATTQPERVNAPLSNLQPLLEPAAVAVAGASSGGTAQANQYIRNLRAYGFEGRLYAIHPSAAEIDGLPAYPDFASLPETVDYAYVSVAAARCPPLLAKAGGKVRVAQVMAGGFGEAGSDPAMETALLEAAAIGGVRVLGPNCMGTHSPSGKLTYMSGVDAAPGHVAVMAQSGGLSTDVLRRGAQRGLKFRALITVGNSADVGPAELLEAFHNDTKTHVIGIYIEDARRGRQLFDTLRAQNGHKPIVLLVGGTTAQGSRAAASHTGALAGDARAWSALGTQCGVAITQSLDEFLDVMLAMQCLTPTPGRVTQEVVLFGNGGGTSVLAADAFGRAGLQVSPLPVAAQNALRDLNLPQGTSVINPIDAPAMALAREDGAVARRIVDGIFAHARPDAFVVHMNVPVILGYSHADILGNLMAATLDARASGKTEAHLMLVLRSDGEPEIERRKHELKLRALEAGIPVYDELIDAARALAGFSKFEAGARTHPQGSST